MTGDDNELRRDRDLLRQEIDRSVVAVRQAARRYRRTASILLLVAITAGGLATLLAGDAFRGGQLAANVAETSTGITPSPMARGWRNVCGAIAILTFIGTVATGADSALKISERRTQVFACAGALEALQTTLLRESTVSRDELDDTRLELARVRREYSEYFV